MCLTTVGTSSNVMLQSVCLSACPMPLAQQHPNAQKAFSFRDKASNSSPQPVALLSNQQGAPIKNNPLEKNCYYRPRSRGDIMFGSVRVSVHLSVGTLLFELFDLIFGMRVNLDLG